MKKTYYIDSYSKKHIHEMFNASSLLMFSKIYDIIEYRADFTSKNCVSNLLNGLPSNVNFKKISIINDKNSFYRFIKQLYSIIYNCYYIILAHKQDLVIINYNTMIALYPINFLTSLLKKNVLVICHGEMYDLVGQRKTSRLFNLSKTLFISNKIKIADGLYFSVLGDFILNNLKEHISNQVLNKTITFDHLAIFDNEVIKKNENNNIIEIGIIGTLRKSKGFDDILDIIRSVNNVNIRFSVIGSYNFEKEYLQKLGFYVPNEVNGSYLSREKMNELIKSLDFALFILPKDIYKFTSSGSFFDALNCETPIIALKNDFIDYYYEKYGKFGFILNSKKDLIDFLQKINCQVFEFDFKLIKNKLNPEKYSKIISSYLISQLRNS